MGELGIPEDALNFQRGRDGYPRPFRNRPTQVQWREFAQHLIRCHREGGFDLVIIDTLAEFWPVENENEPSQVKDALDPLTELNHAGAAVLLVHHTRKGGGRGSAAHRGSFQITGTTDVNIALGVTESGTRVLTAQGRYDETPPRLAYRREGDRLCVVAGKAEGGEVKPGKATDAAILAALGNLKVGVTVAEVAALLGCKETTIRPKLKAGANAGKWTVTGSGKKNDP